MQGIVECARWLRQLNYPCWTGNPWRDFDVVDPYEDLAGEEIMEEKPISDAVTRKKRKCGIVYISTLPPHMNVTKVREIFSAYGDIGRVFLQPADTGKCLKLCIVSLEYIRATALPLFYC